MEFSAIGEEGALAAAVIGKVEFFVLLREGQGRRVSHQIPHSFALLVIPAATVGPSWAPVRASSSARIRPAATHTASAPVGTISPVGIVPPVSAIGSLGPSLRVVALVPVELPGPEYVLPRRQFGLGLGLRGRLARRRRL